MKMNAEQRELLRSYLVACRHDIAHLRGWSDADNKAWALANLDDAEARYLEAYADAQLLDGDALDYVYSTIKAWAQA